MTCWATAILSPLQLLSQFSFFPPLFNFFPLFHTCTLLFSVSVLSLPLFCSSPSLRLHPLLFFSPLFSCSSLPFSLFIFLFSFSLFVPQLSFTQLYSIPLLFCQKATTLTTHNIKGLAPTVHTKQSKIKVPRFAFTDTQQLHIKSGNRDGARCPHSFLSSREWHVEEVFTLMAVVIRFSLTILNINNKNQSSVTTKGRSNATLWMADAAKTGQEEDAKHNLQFNTATCELMRRPFCLQNAHKKILLLES